MNSRIYNLVQFYWPLYLVLLLTNWLPDNVVFLRFRGLLARRFFKSCGKGLSLGRNLVFVGSEHICLGINVYIAYGSWFVASTEGINIGDEVMFGPYCVIASGNHKKVNGSYRFSQGNRAPIKVGRGTWIGAHVTLTAGVDLGMGCLVGANSVVARGVVPDDCVIGGIPARFIKSSSEEV